MTSRARAPLAAAAGSAACVVAVLALVYGVAPVGSADANALHGLMQVGGGRVRSLLTGIAHSADALPLVAMLGVVAAVGAGAGRRRHAVLAVALVAGAATTTEIMKLTLAHQRVYPILGSHQIDATAFPSGHATAAMALALAAVLVAPARWRPLVVMAGAVYAVAVSTSILVLGWHFPSDVLGGMLVASAWFCLAVAALRSSERRVGESAGSSRGTSVPWRETGVGAAAIALGVALARAGSIADFAQRYTTAATAALVLAACALALVTAASRIADR